MKYVLDINMVRPGMKLLETVVAPNGIALIKGGTVLTENHIELLKRRGTSELSIDLNPDEKEKYQYDNNVIPTVSTGVVKKVAGSLKNINNGLDDTKTEEILEYAKRLTDDIFKNKDFVYKLTDYKGNTDYYEHIVRTATYAVNVAKTYNASLSKLNITDSEIEARKISLENIATAALLHGIGKLCNDEKVRVGIKNYVYLGDKFPGLTQDKIKELKSKYDGKFDSYYGYSMIRDNNVLPSEVKVMVLFSDENDNDDGPLKPLGYRNITDKHIICAKIINLCSLFDTYMMDNIKEEITLENAYYQFMNLFKSGAFDEKLSAYFRDSIPLYPVGTKVLVHGIVDSYAVVIENFTDDYGYTRPKLLTIPDKEIVDLREITDTTIKQVVGDEVKMYELLTKANSNEDSPRKM